MGFVDGEGEWDFRPAPKIGHFLHRTVPVDETLARVSLRAKLVPISRVADLTPLDRLRLPVYSATTPLAKDLTTHLGKGLSAQSARLSAMVEAIERVSAESTVQPTYRRTFARLTRDGWPAVDPHDFDLPDDTRYADGVPISWIEGRDLVAGKPAWIPLDLVVTPPTEGVLRHADTNGLGAGNTMLEAVVHALCEVIERDALGQWLFRASFADPDAMPGGDAVVVPESLPDACHPWLDRIAANGLSLTTEMLPQDIGVPVFRSALVDPAFPGSDGCRRRSFVGFGAAPSAPAAAVRSITEAVQSRVGVVQGARDSFNSLAPPRRGPTRHQTRISLAEVSSFASDDLHEDYRYLLGRLTGAGFDRVIAVSLSRPDLGIAVARVRVPGLTSFAVNRRRVGWRCLRHLL